MKRENRRVFHSNSGHRIGLALLGGLLLGKAQPAAAAESQCLGQWHFELGIAVPASQDWLSEASWCRVQSLPRAFDVRLRWAENRSLDLSGKPFRPVDVLTSGTRCEFKFEGKASGLPDNYGITFEVDGAETAVFGKGVCSEHDPKQADGTRTGISIGILVKATHLVDGAAPPAGRHPNAVEPPPSVPPEPWDVVSSQGFRMVLPGPSKTYQEAVALPWGKATETIRQVEDAFTNTMYLFGTYAWARARTTTDRASLRKMRAFFLKNRGCGAHDLRGAALADAQGKVWPQTVFEGECEAGDSFRVAFLLVGNALYHFQAVQQATLHRLTRLPLDEALVRLVGSFSVVE
jgi:hypothetical protein